MSLRKLISRLSLLNDVTAGSREEYLTVNEVKGFMEELGIDVCVHPLDVLSWRDLECSVSGYPCVSLPPVLGRSVYGVLTDDVSRCSGKVLLLSTTEFPDNVWVLYNLAVEAGAEAVVFYDAFPSRFRRIVVTGVWSYSLEGGSLPPIPAVHLRYEDGVRLRELIGKYVEVGSSTDLRLGTGYIVEGVVGGAREGEVLVVAHHDRWFIGFRDNLVGTYTLLRIAERASSGSIRYSLRLVSLTAEEFGNPKLSPWYWSYGSRAYVRYRDLSNVEYVVNVDTACSEPVRVNATGPEIGKYFVKYATMGYVYEGFDHPYSDGLSFSSVGIPTVTLQNLRDIDSVYHTDLDLPYDVGSLVESISTWILNSVNDYDLSKLETREYLELVRDSLPEEVRGLIDEALTLGDVEKLARFLRHVSKTLVRPVVIGSYRDLNKDMITVLIPHALVVNRLREGMGVSIRVPGTEETLCCGRVDDELISRYVQYLRGTVEGLIKELR